MNNIFSIIFKYSNKVTYEWNLPVREVIKQLSEKTKRADIHTSVTMEVPESTLVGKLTEEKVILYRVRPYFGNLFKPCFYGSFERHGNMTFLVGAYSMSRTATSIVIFCFVVIFLAMLLSGLAVLRQTPGYDIQYIPVIIGATLILFFSIIYFGKRLGRDDVEWISDKIKN